MNIDKKADKLLSELAERGQDHLIALFKEIEGGYLGLYSDFIAINEALESEGLVSKVGKTEAYNITAKGRKVVDDGGYKKYIEKKRLEEEQERKHKQSIRTKDYWQSKVAKWQVYLFWPLFAIAVLGAIGNGEKVWNLVQKVFSESPDPDKKNQLEAASPVSPAKIDSVKND